MAKIGEREMYHLTHGDFSESAIIAQQLRDVLRSAPHWSRALDYQQREALDQIIGCMANIINGDASHNEHWRSISRQCMLTIGHNGDDDGT